MKKFSDNLGKSEIHDTNLTKRKLINDKTNSDSDSNITDQQDKKLIIPQRSNLVLHLIYFVLITVSLGVASVSLVLSYTAIKNSNLSLSYVEWIESSIDDSNTVVSTKTDSNGVLINKSTENTAGVYFKTTDSDHNFDSAIVSSTEEDGTFTISFITNTT